MDACVWPTSKVDLNIFNYDNIPGKGLLQLLEKNKYTDVTFLVEGHQISAHRCIVASQSDYFDCLLFGSMKEAQSKEITLEDTSLEAFRVLLSYMYSGIVKTLDLLTAVDLLALADRYGFVTLSQSIEKKLCATIHHTNVLQLLFHSEVYNAHSLNQACLNFVDTNAEPVLAGNTILALPKEHLKFIISRDTFLVDEIQIFRAVQRWKEHNKMRPEEMADVLQCVRLSEIPSGDLMSIVLPSGLYSCDSVCFSAQVQHTQSIAFMSTRGKRGQNLLEDNCTTLMSVQNYTVDELPNELPNELLHATVVNLAFTSKERASLEETSITLEFDEVYLINELRLEGRPSGTPMTTWKAGDPFCYMVDVSRDLYQWIRVVNYSNLKCYSAQQLYFPKQAVKFVRFVQAKGYQEFTVHFSSCSYASSVPFEFRKEGIMDESNMEVAHSFDVLVLVDGAPLTPFTPAFSEYLKSDNCLRYFITFNQPYAISQLRFKLKGLSGVGSVSVHVSKQNKSRHYQKVADIRAHHYDSELHMTFPERTVSIISVTIPIYIVEGEKKPMGSVKLTVEDLFCQANQLSEHTWY